MDCPYQNLCGGCPLRYLGLEKYKQYKQKKLQQILSAIHQDKLSADNMIFIEDGLRRRAEMTFKYQKGKLILGFNAAKTHDVIDIEQCFSLEKKLNDVLPEIRLFLTELCRIKTAKKIKNKVITEQITSGEIALSKAENGVDILLKIDNTFSLEHRMCVCDFANRNNDVIRVAHKRGINDCTETLIEKMRPYINISGHNVFIPSGTFLQASQNGEKTLIDCVKSYLRNVEGKIADLFCGIGTFSYPLADNIRNKITAIDSSEELLDNFQKTVNTLTIPNIKIIKRNLFKYPLDADELKEFNAVIFDPPRAGAHAQVDMIVDLNQADKPQKIVAVSCNPNTFVYDANRLIESGYKLSRLTPVDQFVYADHLELVALFEKD